jgi:putative OPT family oligopeptide transporter
MSKDSLSKNAYGGIDGEKYVPFIADAKNLSQGSIKAILIGILLAILFAGANTYLGLTAGMTIAGGIPGAILGSGLLYTFFRKKSILEGNVMQSMSSGGESIASGMIFVLPAIIIIGGSINIKDAIIASIMGLILGVFIIVLIRKYLIVKSHGELLYPESMAISEVLVTSNATESKNIYKLVSGALIGALVKLLGSEALRFFNDAPTKIFTSIKAQFGIGVSPALIGVGFIVGTEVAFAMLAGSILANFAFVPLFSFFGELVPSLVVFPSSVPISEMSPSAIGSRYIRYIGAGAIATGGLISIIKALPTVIVSVKQAFGNVSISASDKYNQDISIKLLGLLVLVCFAVIMFIPQSLILGIIVAILTIMCAFLFSVVAARMTGIVGTSNLPVSGMTIASLLVITPVFALWGYTDINSMALVLLLGTTLVIAIALSGGFSQSLKTTFILGGNTKIVQKAFILASIFGLIVVFSLIMVLDKVYGFTSENSILIAPQANLMALIVKGISSGDLPWTFILSGVAIAIMLSLLQLPVMSIAIGFYLPITTVMAVVCGGVLRWFIEKKYNKDKNIQEEKVGNGIILSAGLVAGESLIGLLVAILALSLGSLHGINMVGGLFLPNMFIDSIAVGFMILFLFMFIFYRKIIKNYN